jgi:hypothetical protein
MQRLGRAEHVHAVAAAHLEVAEHNIVLPLVELLDGDIAVRRLVHVVAGVRQRADDTAPQRIVVVCNKNPSHVILSPGTAEAVPYKRELPNYPNS